ncbi:MAG: hybrid sensor histidine kinase/response regulator [Alphaproteobacteria bacterium]|nr:hybrid sensor histidine kinase/response regulator [Alphaproteobacteria bacterium]
MSADPAADTLSLAEETAPEAPPPAAPRAVRGPWKILVVDDDPEVHAITRVVLQDTVFRERPVTLLGATSAAEAFTLLQRHRDVAVLLLDVVMETEDAGLQLVRHVREQLGNRQIRIILRTGLPGQAPERSVILDHDINDYKAKTELTAQKLFTAVIASLRAYDHIAEVELTRRDLQLLKAMEEDLRNSKEHAEATLQQLKAAQDGLVQAEKMAALGSLVAGISHEINTPIGTALTSASHLAERTAAHVRLFEAGTLKKSDLERYFALAKETCELMLANVQRAAQLVQSFKQISVDQTSAERRRFDLATYIDEILLSLRPRLKRTPHRIVVDCPPDLSMDSFPGALSQVLTNFIMNSLTHGFDDARAGTITIRVSEPTETEVEIDYSDDGRGIPKQHLTRIFEPFFTTKRGAGGSGLGLHIVFNLVTQTLGGTIRAMALEGSGATFLLRLPKVREAEPPKPAPTWDV